MRRHRLLLPSVICWSALIGVLGVVAFARHDPQLRQHRRSFDSWRSLYLLQPHALNVCDQ